MSVVEPADHEDLRMAAAAAPEERVLHCAGVVAVLQGPDRGTCTLEEAQAWASFVRRGYVSRGPGPTSPIDIDYVDAWEDDIVEVVARLDEIGDAVDGQLSEAEVLLMLRLLGVP